MGRHIDIRISFEDGISKKYSSLMGKAANLIFVIVDKADQEYHVTGILTAGWNELAFINAIHSSAQKCDFPPAKVRITHLEPLIVN